MSCDELGIFEAATICVSTQAKLRSPTLRRFIPPCAFNSVPVGGIECVFTSNANTPEHLPRFRVSTVVSAPYPYWRSCRPLPFLTMGSSLLKMAFAIIVLIVSNKRIGCHNAGFLGGLLDSGNHTNLCFFHTAENI